jgi:hypothetical protein
MAGSPGLVLDQFELDVAALGVELVDRQLGAAAVVPTKLRAVVRQRQERELDGLPLLSTPEPLLLSAPASALSR